MESNLWNTQREENSFLVVEDEFQNLFELTRLFATRGTQQGFINVISENYLLRDYMLGNAQTFISDPKAPDDCGRLCTNRAEYNFETDHADGRGAGL